MVSDFPTASPGTPLKSLYGLASSGLPIAVVDDEGRLTMVVEAAALLRKLAESREADVVPKQEDRGSTASAA
jgi:hypothetical protein